LQSCTTRLHGGLRGPLVDREIESGQSVKARAGERVATELGVASETRAEGLGTGPAPVLELHDITVHFGGIAAVDGVSLEVRAGEVCGLIGPNGAGKTTLFDVVSGVRHPDRGRVLLDGREITHWTAVTRARRGLRRTFQRVQTYGWLSVEDNVLAALEWDGGGGGLLADLVAFPTRRARERARRARVAEALELCGLTAVRREPAGSLPIGLARMLELARAIVDSPRVLLLDEPTSGLDDTEMARLGERIQSIRAEQSCAVLLVEHDVSFVMGRCDRIVVLDLGRLLAVGRPKEIQENVAVRAAYLGEG
jgi:branched-chain amino acid transport system ATP-binding protein